MVKQHQLVFHKPKCLIAVIEEQLEGSRSGRTPSEPHFNGRSVPGVKRAVCIIDAQRPTVGNIVHASVALQRRGQSHECNFERQFVWTEF